MTDTIENQSTDQEKIVQENTSQQVIEPIVQTTETENSNEIHWKNFREKRKEERRLFAEKERELAQKREEAEALKKALEAVMTPNYPQQNKNVNVSYTDAYVQENDDEKRILDKVNQLLEQKEKEREERRRQQEHAEYPQKLQSVYQDFNHIVSEENLDYLQFHYPEVAKPYSLLPDSFEKWEGIYKAVKKFIPNLDKEKDMKKIDKNMQKPIAMSRPGMTSTSEQAPHIGLTDDQRAKNWERMRKLMKGV